MSLYLDDICDEYFYIILLCCKVFDDERKKYCTCTLKYYSLFYTKELQLLNNLCNFIIIFRGQSSMLIIKNHIVNQKCSKLIVMVVLHKGMCNSDCLDIKQRMVR